jgi:hypothetical protein
MKVYVTRSGGHKITRGGDAHEMMIKVIKHEKVDLKQSNQGKGITIGFCFCRSKMSREVTDRV